LNPIIQSVQGADATATVTGPLVPAGFYWAIVAATIQHSGAAARHLHIGITDRQRSLSMPITSSQFFGGGLTVPAQVLFPIGFMVYLLAEGLSLQGVSYTAFIAGESLLLRYIYYEFPTPLGTAGEQRIFGLR
jgi:hypothetical protein